MGIGWRPCSRATGVTFFQKLSQALWYLDPHHSKFADRGISIPHLFSTYRGYNDFKRKKEKEPRLSTDGLNHHIEQLNNLLLQPWMSGTRVEVLRSDIDKLVDALHRYKQYLVSQNERVNKSHHQQSADQASEGSNASLITISPKGNAMSHYQELEAELLKLPLYEPLFLNDIAPVDRYQRRKWFSEVTLPFPIMLYKYAYGNNLGTLVYAWRIPLDVPVDDTIIGQIFSQLCRKQSFSCYA